MFGFVLKQTPLVGETLEEEVESGAKGNFGESGTADNKSFWPIRKKVDMYIFSIQCSTPKKAFLLN